jgi:hypothetical protein
VAKGSKAEKGSLHGLGESPKNKARSCADIISLIVSEFIFYLYSLCVDGLFAERWNLECCFSETHKLIDRVCPPFYVFYPSGSMEKSFLWIGRCGDELGPRPVQAPASRPV